MLAWILNWVHKNPTGSSSTLPSVQNLAVQIAIYRLFKLQFTAALITGVKSERFFYRLPPPPNPIITPALFPPPLSLAETPSLFLQGLTTVLFPLTVVKTRQQAIEGTPSGLQGAAQIARNIVRHDGFRGLYRGFGTVVIGVLPARGVRHCDPRIRVFLLLAGCLDGTDTRDIRSSVVFP